MANTTVGKRRTALSEDARIHDVAVSRRRTDLSADFRAQMLYLAPDELMDQLEAYVLDEDSGAAITHESSGISMNLHVYGRRTNLSADLRE